MIRVFALISTAFLLVTAPPAHADDNTYLDYYHSHGGTPWPDYSLIAGGYKVCSALHSGASREDVLRGTGPIPGMFNVAVDAAQHELCPDTLR